MEKIAIIVPVYNVEPYIRRCVDSLINQTYNNIQIILVDDGSPDDCGKICDEYVRADDRIVCIHKENGGLASARNAGLDWLYKNSDAQWISFVDSDDWVQEKYIEALYNAVITYNALISISGFVFWLGENSNRDSYSFGAKVWDPEQLLISDIVKVIASCGKLFNRNLWSDLRFPNYRIHEDDFIIYKLIFGCKIAVLDEPLYFYFQNPRSLTHSEWSPKRLAKFVAKKEQIIFFKSNNFKQAYEFAIFHYLFCYSAEISNIKNLLPKYKEYYRYLIREQKKEIKNYKYEIKIPYAGLYIKRFGNDIGNMSFWHRVKLLGLYIKQFGLFKLLLRSLSRR